ncbi:microcystin synthetase [Candidatus Thiomargarita nelsonii]|uniref:Microcystin synthetase n=1 Tax=Candidatus Thiomargarita nelsonii TaxID=1003181 RepID=A0A176S2A5_9GAMM|nr:microcystin synthetase [Candidatus Thiomargarita nelsonii]
MKILVGWYTRRKRLAGDRRLLAYVVSDLEKSGTEFVQKWQNEHISHWETIWQSTYVDNDARDLKLNLAGWNSSFTGTPIPEKEMKEWVQNTVTRIRSLKPDRVLEIGCGTGLLMSRIAPNCQEYWGTDFSQKALDEVQKIQGLNNVRLFNKSADDLGWIEPESFDTVILNSVVQYFPDIHYLLKVLVNVISLVKPGGHIFVGDVRNLSLFKAFNAAIQLYQAPDSLTLKKLNERIEQRMSLEEELVIEPSFFNALKETQTAITHISVWLKQGEYHNELTQYRKMRETK